MTSSDNSAEAAKGRVQDFRRNSAGIFALRRSMLTESQRDLVRSLTWDVARAVYPADSFQ